jgi:hypothetical protein
MPRIPVSVVGMGALAFIAIQFVRPTISQPPVTADLDAPREVKQILRNSCYDCHSNQTHLGWFDEIVPAYWLVARDVERGRSKLNFSEIGKLPAGQQKGALYEAVNQIQLGAMPLANYTRLHRGTLITPAQLSVLKDYLNSTTVRGPATPSDITADDAQYGRWQREGGRERSVPAAPNGIEFPSGYRNWRAISSTDRFDNGTIRVILGNDTAVQAIAQGHINPWPDGSTLAKVAWFARDDGHGQIRPGAFFQVEFMIRDRKKYATTLGWGWARWRGDGLTPYGKDAGFSAECVGCHTPLRDNDYVFTVPPPMPQLPSNPMQWGVIASSIDESSASISTLFGNAAAVQYARSNSEHNYPASAVLSLVTWTMQEDRHWFGARIPQQVKSIESVNVATDDHSAGSRAAYLLSLRAAVMP